jgi:hypothetical protein
VTKGRGEDMNYKKRKDMDCRQKRGHGLKVEERTWTISRGQDMDYR